MNAKIRLVLEDEKRGKDWLVAAVVHGSIGYYSPLGAENCINDYVQGQRENYSERCASCFGSDLEKEILHDLSSFESLPPEKQNRVLGIIKQVRKLDSVSQMTFGLLYPSQMT
jgi:hypothetical protein